jgi:hypothetical protein
MLFDQFLGSPRVATDLLALLPDLRSPTGSSLLDAFFAADVGGAIVSRFVPAASDCPAYYFAVSASRLCVLVDGVQTLTQGLGVWNGYIGSFAGNPPPEVNQWYVTAANYIIARINALAPIPPNVQLYGGHSVGGCIACLVARALKQANGNVQPYVHTFGSPRIGDALTADTLDPVSIWRWMNTDDPVPLLPPLIADVPALAFATPAHAWIRFSHFVHTRGGIQVDSLGNLTPEELPTTASIGQTSNLVAWLATLDGTSNNSHSIGTYAANILATFPRLTPPEAQGLRFAPEEPATHVSRQEVNAQEAASYQIVHAASERQNSADLTIPPRQVFRAIRQGRIWAVVFADQVVSLAPTKRSARGVARSFNESLRRLQVQGVVDPTAFSAQLQAYFVEAVDPASGFVPPMNTVMA